MTEQTGSQVVELPRAKTDPEIAQALHRLADQIAEAEPATAAVLVICVSARDEYGLHKLGGGVGTMKLVGILEDFKFTLLRRNDDGQPL